MNVLFQKNKMEVGFGYKNSSFSRDNYGNCGPKKKFGEGGKKLGEISTKIKHKKQIFRGNCCKNRTF